MHMVVSTPAITQLSVQLVIEAPFFGHLLTGMLKQEAAGARAALTIGPGYQPLLLLGPALLSGAGELTAAQRLGVLKHELLHLLFRHPLLLGRAADQLLFHLAADLVVNQFLDAVERPADAFTLDQLDALEAQPWQPVWYYYGLLLEGVRQKLPAVRPLLETAAAGSHAELRRHRYWASVILTMEAAEVALLQDTVTELTRTALQRLGADDEETLPPPLRLALSGLFPGRKPAIDWRRALRLFAAGSRRTSIRNTIRRPSRRYGTAPGIKVRRGSRLLIAVDTSASVAAHCLQAFWAEIHQLWRLGHELQVVENDTAIRSRQDYRGYAPSFAQGRGGTDYQAPLQLANEVLHPDGVVFFTDGEGPAPAIRCRYPLLWVIAGNEKGESLPGRTIFMGNEAC